MEFALHKDIEVIKKHYSLLRYLQPQGPLTPVLSSMTGKLPVMAKLR
jgi:hypothetical protein